MPADTGFIDMQLPFLNMHGNGNRIFIVDARGRDAAIPATQTLRRLGRDAPGFDQLMWLEDGQGGIPSYRVFNNDGSEARQCGNGLRCLGWMLTRDGRPHIRLDSPAGPVEARIGEDGRIAVSMGQPRFLPAEIPFLADAAADVYALDVDGEQVEIRVVSMGNPHCVLVVDDVASAPVAELGAKLESHPRFPEKANVGFMAIRDPGHIDLRVFERGAGETLACGTGACAAAVAGIRAGLLSGDVQVTVPGGELMVSWRPETVWLTGDVELLDEGSIDL